MGDLVAFPARPIRAIIVRPRLGTENDYVALPIGMERREHDWTRGTFDTVMRHLRDPKLRRGLPVLIKHRPPQTVEPGDGPRAAP